MTPMTDEQAVRTALADLTNDQPPMPPGRFRAVQRRAVRHRKRQLAGAVVAVLAVAGIAAGVGRIPGILQQQPQARQVPGWALAWPDYRNGSVPQSVLNNAVLAWHEEAVGQTSHAPPSRQQIARQVASYHVIWYVGQKVGRGQAVAVMFEATSPKTGPVLVVGWADAAQVMRGQPAWSANSSPWILTTKAAPGKPGSFGPDISEYISVSPAAGTATDTWIAILPAPGEALQTWTTNSTAAVVAVKGEPSSRVFAADVGQLHADVALGLGGARTEYVPVGTGNVAAVPPLAPPPALTPPASFSKISDWAGQGNELDGDSGLGRSGGPYAVLGSCYNAAANQAATTPPTPSGHGPLGVTINGHSIGSISCDNQQHELAIPGSLLQPHRILVGKSGSNLTSWRVALGRVH